MTHEELYESKSQMKRVEILKAEEKQMTHEELLAKIDSVTGVEHNEQSMTIVYGIAEGYIKFRTNQALRAVVELHKPVSVIIGDRNGTIHTKFSKWQCKGCYGEYNQPRGIYPCPTIQAIQEQLK